MKKALIVWGGWDGHEPDKVAEVFRRQLVTQGFEVEVSNTLDAYRDIAELAAVDVIVPVWTMGAIAPEQLNPLLAVVRAGVGIAGCHGGMCDSFRNETEYQFMTGGQWVAHPGGDGVHHRVRITDHDHVITRDIKDFDVCSEQYYLHTDPAVKVLAATRFPTVDGPHAPNGLFDMPVAWTKYYGRGRVFYCSLGHHADIFDIPEALEIMTRGLVWAARTG
ncbi:MAG: ThuA domain-containing protein [Candidatus Sumerlaeota bacterium]|nr:ThuA domain-containing protein [Candidatus Sumerlaeota bacterium]